MPEFPDILRQMYESGHRTKALQLESQGAAPIPSLPLGYALEDAMIDPSPRPGSVWRSAPQGKRQHQRSQHMFTGPGGVPASRAVDVRPVTPLGKSGSIFTPDGKYDPNVLPQVLRWGHALHQRAERGETRPGQKRQPATWGGNWENVDQPHGEFRPGKSRLKLASPEYQQRLMEDIVNRGRAYVTFQRLSDQYNAINAGAHVVRSEAVGMGARHAAEERNPANPSVDALPEEYNPKKGAAWGMFQKLSGAK